MSDDGAALSVPVGGLPAGQRVRATIEGTMTQYGSVKVETLRSCFVCVPVDRFVSVEPVPVVPEPGRWYEASTCHWFALPNGWLIEYDDKGFHVAYPPASIVHMFGPLVECEPPAEFRRCSTCGEPMNTPGCCKAPDDDRPRAVAGFHTVDGGVGAPAEFRDGQQ